MEVQVWPLRIMCEEGFKLLPLSSCMHTAANPACDTGDVRLVNGNTDLQGRLEVCFAGTWGTVCNDRFDSNDASVVCAQLGFSRRGEEGLIRGGGRGEPPTLPTHACKSPESQ